MSFSLPSVFISAHLSFVYFGSHGVMLQENAIVWQFLPRLTALLKATCGLVWVGIDAAQPAMGHPESERNLA